MGKRRQAREKVMKALFAYELSGTDPEQIIDTTLQALKEEAGTDAYEFAVSLFMRTLDHRSEIDDIITAHATNWDLDRIAVLDKVLLRLAIAEFLYTKEVPPKVSIDEALEIAKRYSTEKSAKFINGVLDAALETLLEEGRIRKSGRGLIGMDPLEAQS